jgi:MFS family permease
MRMTDVPEPRRRVRVYAVYAVALLAAMALFNTVDLTVLPAVLSSIQAEFHLSDTELGLLNAAFTVAFAVSAIPIGYWADRGSRRMIIGVGVAVWSLFTLLTGLTQSFAQMLAVRSVVGIGEASYQPAGGSLIGDYYDKGRRGRANAAVVTLGGLGIGGGFIIGGAVGLQFGWRAAFFLVAGPGLLLALLAFTIREPLRGAAESAGPRLAAARDTGLRAFGRLLRVRSFVAAVAASVLSLFGFSILGFLPLYVERRFGLDLAQAGGLVGIPQLGATILATPLVGALIDWRARRTPRAAVEVGFGGTLLAGLGAIVMFTAGSLPVFVAGEIVFSVMATAATLAPIVIMQNVVVPSLRASAGSLNLTASRLLGSALSPIVVGAVSDLAHGNLGLSMLVLGPSAFVLSAGSLALALGSMKQDAGAMEASWAANQAREATELPTLSPAEAAGRA